MSSAKQVRTSASRARTKAAEGSRSLFITKNITAAGRDAIGLTLVGADGRIVSVDAAFAKMLGWQADQCIGQKLSDVIHLSVGGKKDARPLPIGADAPDTAMLKGTCHRRDGSSFPARVTISAMLGEEGATPAWGVELKDLQQEKRAEAELAKVEVRVNYALESAQQGVWDYDFNTKDMFYSDMWRTMRGIGLDEEVDSSQEAWFGRIHPDDVDRIKEIVRGQDSGEIERNAFEYRERHRDGHWIWILSRGKLVEWNPDGSPARAIGTDTDITKMKEEEARRAAETEKTFRDNLNKLQEAHAAAEAAQQLANSLARHDPLTGLPNRRVFTEVLEKSITKARKGDAPFALLFIDLDGFKSINDMQGHSAGDAVLCEVAERLKQVVREADVVARLGGDEFAVILDCARSPKTPQIAAERTAERAISTIEESITFGGASLKVGASIGISICPTDGADPDMLLHASDMAMYHAKHVGRGAYYFYESSMDAAIREQSALEEDVRRAVANEEIVPYYQPLVKLAENQLVGFEILARWQHPERGDVPPSVFIPVAERLGLIAELSYSLLQRACLDASKWPSHLVLSLNVSPVHLDDPLLPVKIMSILSECDFPPNRLEVEVTEDAVMHDIESAQRTMKTLKDLGIKISLDDFGTGYSNLSQLRQFHFDKIKIDRSFVRSMETDIESAKLVHSILDLAKNLGLPTIAEGIEHVAALKQILAGGGEYGQGYYFGKAMTADQALAVIQRQATAAGDRGLEVGVGVA